ncbi:MAG: DNA polymerase I [Eubacteriales bacterium]
MQQTILVVDGNSIINRAYYGIRPLTTRTGKHTNAIYGMINIISRQLEALAPDYAAVAFDLKHPTFRHRLYPEYKAGRRPTPDELLSQFDDAKACLRAMGLSVLELPGYEADDIQGTLARLAQRVPGTMTYILSGDRDLLQLIDERTTVLLAGNRETVTYDTRRFVEEYAIKPTQLVDAKALMGDPSDHIPGVAGIGEKTALALIARFETLDNLYEHLDSPDMKAGVRDKLAAGKDSAFLSRTLATIMTDVPLPHSLEQLRWGGIDKGAFYAKCAELEFAALIRKYELTPPAAEATPASAVCVNETCHLPAGEIVAGIGERFAVQLLCDEVYLYSPSLGQVCPKEGVTALTPLFDGTKEVVCYDSKAMLHYLYRHDIPCDTVPLDLMLYAYVLHGTHGQATPAGLALSVLGQSYDPDTPAPELLWQLEAALRPEVRANGCERLLFEVELPLACVLAEMERTGFKLDRTGMVAFGEELTAAADAAAERICMMAGRPFNINSPKQLGEVLFEELGLPVQRKTKTGYSTDAEVLEKLRHYHPIVEEVLEYRQLTKLYSTYAVGLVAAADRDDRIHTDFRQALTATGRLSSSEPNLQNIPIRTPLGRRMRQYFITDPGRVLVDADYSQIELRLLAHLAGDAAMSEAFREGRDIHAATAAAVFGVPLYAVTDELRKRAKAVNFGIVYGIGPYSLSQDLHISQAQAKRYIDSYLASYPGIRDYLDRTIEEAEACGYTTTILGRRRYIPELKASNAVTRAFGRRVAMNSPIQGSAADMMKVAMLAVHRRLRREVPAARLVMQVHDELIVEAPQADVPAVRRILREEMEGALSLSVPLTADVSAGDNWLDAK